LSVERRKRLTTKKGIRKDDDTSVGVGIGIGVWKGEAMDSLKFHPDPPCQNLLRPMGGLQPSSIPLDTPRRTPMEDDMRREQRASRGRKW
jgi:hypothetical protein